MSDPLAAAAIIAAAAEILAERDRLKAVNAELVEALTAAELTYQALDRNREPIIVALAKLGLPTAWFAAEIAKAVKVRAAIAKARGES